MLVGKGPAEKDEVRPEVKQLGCVDFGNVVGFVAQNDAAIDDYECGEGNDEGEEGLQCPDDSEKALWLGGQLSGASDDGNHGFDIVCAKSQLH